MLIQNVSLNGTEATLPLTLVAAPALLSQQTIGSQRASIRRMKALLASPPTLNLISETTRRTERFIKNHPLFLINQTLMKFGATSKDIGLFKQLIAQETEGFLGYQAGSSTGRIFQDVLSIIVKDILQIPMKDDFVFLRVPGDPAFHFDSAKDFINEEAQYFSPPGIPGKKDSQPEIRQHIVSMNMSLYQSYDATWDLTPRYYLENTTWTQANVRDILKPFLSKLGISGKQVDGLWFKALDLLKHDRGYILQFFDESKNYAFAKEHSYVSYSGGRPHPAYPKHELLFDDKISNFPQLRLVMSNDSTLNPFSSLSIKRFDNLTDEERGKYESSLRSLLEGLSFDPKKVENLKKELLAHWIEND